MIRCSAALPLLLFGCVGDNKPSIPPVDLTPTITDADGDGYNADEDCDDYNSLVHPGATELCDGFDNDCDGTVDEDVTTSYYADRDRDGFGDAGDVTEACSQPAGYIPNGNDCNDDAATAYPGGEEVCDGLDNNCNGTIDEGVGAAYYADADSDGFGDPDAVFFSCEPVSGYVSDSSDCDDTDDSSYPGGEEVCDGADNNCNGTIDEGVTSTFYVDTDADSYGVADKTAEACARPTGFAEVPGDCDDTVPAVNPDAMEVCDDIDNDCDGTIDEDDALDATTWYADSDSDGYGDADHPTVACDAPSGTVPDNSDCDDGTISTNPAADEYCDDVDNDCDGDVDEDDALDATTWYADSDSDGLGDPEQDYQSCFAPSGYVDNNEDCDDSDPRDTDGDGLQDCEDDDIDDDGLRNDWDVDPYDDALARGPNSGWGLDGDVHVSGSEGPPHWSVLYDGASVGDTSFDVHDSSGFVEGDEVLVLSQQGGDAGTWQAVFVSAIDGDTLTVEPPLEDSYSSSSVVLVQRIPHYGDVLISGTLSADPWGGAGGGVVMFRATGDVSISGLVTAYGAGFLGGAGVYGNRDDPHQGESHSGVGSSGSGSTGSNAGGGGAYPGRNDNADSGGGGGYGVSGAAGTNQAGRSVTSGGMSYGSSSLLSWYLGSGGGGGSPDTESDGSSSSNYAGAGGNGGGLIGIFSAGSLTVTGRVSASGSDGDHATSNRGEVGAGGGGSGGMVYLAASSITISGDVEAKGGEGGTSAWHSGSPYGSAYGGDGGDGRVRLDYDSLSGSTSPSTGYTDSYTD